MRHRCSCRRTRQAGFKGKDPTVTRERLHREWLPAADVVYLGKAKSLTVRVDELLRFGNGEPVGHWGGRLVWQVALPLTLSWKETPGQDPETLEKALLREFSGHHGRLPFANLRH